LSKCDDVLQDSCEKLDSTALAKEVMALCRNFVSSLLEGSMNCSISIKDGDEQIVLFDEVLFIHQHCLRTSMCTKDIVDIVDKENENLEKVQLRKRSVSRKETEPLLQRLLRTQCFSSYLSNQK
jgi:repressor of nif and glnA expression